MAAREPFDHHADSHKKKKRAAVSVCRHLGEGSPAKKAKPESTQQQMSESVSMFPPRTRRALRAAQQQPLHRNSEEGAPVEAREHPFWFFTLHEESVGSTNSRGGYTHPKTNLPPGFLDPFYPDPIDLPQQSAAPKSIHSLSSSESATEEEEEEESESISPFSEGSELYRLFTQENMALRERLITVENQFLHELEVLKTKNQELCEVVERQHSSLKKAHRRQKTLISMLLEKHEKAKGKNEKYKL